ncbi:unnamed protein product, partial [Trichogramma brassicae]
MSSVLVCVRRAETTDTTGLPAMYAENSPLMAAAQSTAASAGLLNMEALCQNKNPLAKASMLSWLSGGNDKKTAPNLPPEKNTVADITKSTLEAPRQGKVKDVKLPSAEDFATGDYEDKLFRVEELILGLANYLQTKGNVPHPIILYTGYLERAIIALRLAGRPESPGTTMNEAIQRKRCPPRFQPRSVRNISGLQRRRGKSGHRSVVPGPRGTKSKAPSTRSETTTKTMSKTTFRSLLEQTVLEHKFDLAIVSDQYRNLQPLYTCLDNANKQAIWVLRGNQVQERPARASLFFTWARVHGIYIFSVYAPPRLTDAEFAALLSDIADEARSKRPLIVAGDFNAWSTEWGSDRATHRGMVLLDALAPLDVVLLNTEATPTFIGEQGQSIIDLTFANDERSQRVVSWQVGGLDTTSDHQAILYELEDTRPPGPAPRRGCRWSVRLLNREAFANWMSGVTVTSGPPEEMVDQLGAAMIAACDAAMTRMSRRRRREPVYWWTEEIAGLRGACLRARRLAQRARGRQDWGTRRAEYVAAKRRLSAAIKAGKRRCWNLLCEESDRDTWGRPYEIVMSRLRGARAKPPSSPSLVRRAVAALFSVVIEEPIPPPAVPDGEMAPGVSLGELRRACRKLKEHTAPGPDGVPNAALKIAVATRPDIFLQLFTACMRSGVFPRCWKRQKLVFLPKPGKPPDEPTSFRPICMLDAVGKMLEKIICDRLQVFTKSPSGLSDQQFGFQRGRSTIDAIEKVVSRARDALRGRRLLGGTKEYCADAQCTENRKMRPKLFNAITRRATAVCEVITGARRIKVSTSCIVRRGPLCVVTLDVKNAFNTARWNNILTSLERIETPAYLLKIIANYFQDRVLEYSTSDGTDAGSVTAGVPQGSVLGPTLWDVMYDSILRLNLQRSVNIVGFADDIALVALAKHLWQVENHLNAAVAQVREALLRLSLATADQKTEVLLLTSRKRLESITITVGDCHIEYLGVLIDARLRFDVHLAKVCEKATNVAGKNHAKDWRTQEQLKEARHRDAGILAPGGVNTPTNVPAHHQWTPASIARGHLHPSKYTTAGTTRGRASEALPSPPRRCGQRRRAPGDDQKMAGPVGPVDKRKMDAPADPGHQGMELCILIISAGPSGLPEFPQARHNFGVFDESRVHPAEIFLFTLRRERVLAVAGARPPVLLFVTEAPVSLCGHLTSKGGRAFHLERRRFRAAKLEKVREITTRGNYVKLKSLIYCTKIKSAALLRRSGRCTQRKSLLANAHSSPARLLIERGGDRAQCRRWWRPTVIWSGRCTQRKSLLANAHSSPARLLIERGGDRAQCRRWWRPTVRKLCDGLHFGFFIESSQSNFGRLGWDTGDDEIAIWLHEADGIRFWATKDLNKTEIHRQYQTDPYFLFLTAYGTEQQDHRAQSMKSTEKRWR